MPSAPKVFRAEPNIEETVFIGDRFASESGQQWEVISFTEAGAFCKHLTGKIGPEWMYCVEQDGTVEWTEHFIANLMSQSPIRRFATG